MSKISCDVIKDLLPLYEDGVCSEKSREMIEEHLAECPECTKLYEAMQEKLPEITVSGDNREEQDNLHFMKQVKRKYTTRQVITAGIVLLIVLTVWVLPDVLESDVLGHPPIRLIDNRVPVDDVQVENVYEMKNGDIYFSLESDIGFTSFTIPDISNSNYDYYDNWKTGWNDFSGTSSWWERLFFPDSVMYKTNYVVPLTQDVYLDTDYDSIIDRHYVRTSEAIYYVGKNDKKLTIWEKGQKVPKAPDIIEKQAAEQRQNTQFPADEEYPYNVVFWSDWFDQYEAE